MQDILASLNKSFDKIYLLTIKRNINRLNTSKVNLAGVNYDIFFGADGRELNLEEMEKNGQYDSQSVMENTDKQMLKYTGSNHHYTPLPNMVACALSHKMIYEDILKNDYKTALILEDDAILIQQNLQHWPSTLAQLPSDWDLFYLGYEWKHDSSFFNGVKRKYLYGILDSLEIRKYNHNLITNGFSKNYSRNIAIAGAHVGTHAYAITKRCAEVMLKRQTPIQNNPDIAFWEPAAQSIIKAYVAKPKLFTVANTSSSILEN